MFKPLKPYETLPLMTHFSMIKSDYKFNLEVPLIPKNAISLLNATEIQFFVEINLNGTNKIALKYLINVSSKLLSFHQLFSHFSVSIYLKCQNRLPTTN